MDKVGVKGRQGLSPSDHFQLDSILKSIPLVQQIVSLLDPVVLSSCLPPHPTYILDSQPPQSPLQALKKVAYDLNTGINLCMMILFGVKRV